MILRAEDWQEGAHRQWECPSQCHLPSVAVILQDLMSPRTRELRFSRNFSAIWLCQVEMKQYKLFVGLKRVTIGLLLRVTIAFGEDFSRRGLQYSSEHTSGGSQPSGSIPRRSSVFFFGRHLHTNTHNTSPPTLVIRKKKQILKNKFVWLLMQN